MSKKKHIDKYILLNYKEKTNKEMATECQCSPTTIVSHLKHLGLPTDRHRDLSQYNDYIVKHFYNKTAKELSEELSCSKAYIYKIWRQHGLKRKGNIPNQIYKLNEHYFDNINTADKAYLIGFICADGCVYKRNGHQAMLSISVKDIDDEICKHFQTSLETKKPIAYNVQSKKTTMATLQITSDILCDNLIKMSITPRKTWTLDIDIVLKYIPNKFINDFLLGYFDGDGSLCKRNKKIDTCSGYTLSYVGPLSNMQKILNILSLFGIKSSILSDSHREYKHPFAILSIVGTTNKYCFLKFLYSHNINSLNRKKERSLHFINLVETNATNRAENKRAMQAYQSVVLKWEELQKT